MTHLKALNKLHTILSPNIKMSDSLIVGKGLREGVEQLNLLIDYFQVADVKEHGIDQAEYLMNGRLLEDGLVGDLLVEDVGVVAHQRQDVRAEVPGADGHLDVLHQLLQARVVYSQVRLAASLLKK